MKIAPLTYTMGGAIPICGLDEECGHVAGHDAWHRVVRIARPILYLEAAALLLDELILLGDERVVHTIELLADDDADSFDAALSKAASTTVSVDTDKSFVDGLLDSLTNRKDSGASDMDGRSERDRKSDDDKYETFKDKDGNQCRRDRTTGETTVWVEGYDRMRNGKSEHVKSYWKVVRPRG